MTNWPRRAPTAMTNWADEFEEAMEENAALRARVAFLEARECDLDAYMLRAEARLAEAERLLREWRHKYMAPANLNTIADETRAFLANAQDAAGDTAKQGER